jgi:serine phosphatase RsbU (regulator of sigma subunit)
MFGRSYEHKLQKENIDNFNSVVEAIDTLIKLQAWDKVWNSIIDIRQKEKESFNEAMQNFPKKSAIYKKDFDKKEKKIKALEKKLLNNKTKYDAKVEKQRLDIQLKRIKAEVNSLVKNLRYKEALSILSNFLEENRWNTQVSKFYNSEKKKLKKKITVQEKREAKRLETNTHLETQKLLWKKLFKEKKEKEEKKEKAPSWVSKFFWDIKKRFDMKNKIRAKVLLDEVTELIKADNEATEDIVKKKLSNIHAWLVKEINGMNVNGYEIYGKMLWADKISGDTFGLEETKKSYKFFLWDATGHGIRAWLIVSMLSKAFDKFSRKYTLNEMVYNINNDLKQDLESRNFVTWIFFQILKGDINTIDFVGMWHEPMMKFSREAKVTERIIPWGLAAWIRLIKKLEDLKSKSITMGNGDIVLSYTDGIVEAKNHEWEAYWMDRLEKTFQYICELEDDLVKIYTYIIDDLKFFKWGTKFLDDVTLFLVKRDFHRDVITEEEIDEIQKNEKLSKSEIQSIKWLANKEVEIELKKIKEKKELTNIIKNLDNLYVSWEILKLKQECIRFIKDWYVDKKINSYLKKALANEQNYKIKQKNQKIEMKYKVLEELYKKWDYSSVIAEVEDIISKDGNI